MYEIIIRIIYRVFFLKLNAKPRRPLTMAFQKSEYKDHYEPTESELIYLMDRPIHPRNYLYDDEIEHKLTEVKLIIFVNN